MECLKEFLILKRFSFYGYIIAVVCGFVGPFLGLITGLRTEERRQFRCESITDTHQSFVQSKCYHQYDQLYNLSLPLYGFVLLTFVSLAAVAVVYSCWVKSRVDQVEQVILPDAENPRRRDEITTRRVFWSYFIHLIVRFGLGVVFASFLGSQASSFPSKFQCQWDSPKPTTSVNLNGTHSNYNSSSVLIDCYNSVAREKTVWATVVWSLHIVFACLVLSEAFYLLARACHATNFMHDSKFCRTHLFNQGNVLVIIERYIRNSQRRILDHTEFLEPWIPSNLEENDNRKAIDEIYIDLIICTGRVTYEFTNKQTRHELLDVHRKRPDKSVIISNLEELFVNPSTQQSYANILIVGRPGIGKTLLCTKLIRECCRGTLFKNTKTKTFKYVFVYRFRHWNSEEVTRMSLKEFLSRAEHSLGKIDTNVLQSLIDKPKEVLFIFDGLDEFKYREDMGNVDEFTGSNDMSSDVIPVSALYVKLLKKEFQQLSGATVLTTTRPNTVGHLNTCQFDRVVEIVGFTPAKVKSFVTNFCKLDDPEIADRIWQHINSNMNLLYLCYIPVTCCIVCYLLKDSILSQSGSLPTTLTDVYKGALRMYIFKHNREYPKSKGSNSYENENFSQSVEAMLSKLGKLAMIGISERRMVFEKDEVRGMENCGLLNCMPSEEKPKHRLHHPPDQYHFVHLTLQEFVAARYIVENMDPEKVAHFITTNANDINWHLVIQFIAGLVQGKDVVQVNNCFRNTLCESLTGHRRGLSLLMVKCLYELHDENVVKEAACEIINEARWDHKVNLLELDLTSFDCTAIGYTLRQLGTHMKSLDMSFNYFREEGLKALLGQIKEELQVTHLNLDGNIITNKGVSDLCDAMKHENCQLTHLNLDNNIITNKGVSYLCDAMKHENCQLTHLNLGGNHITIGGVSYLCGAMKHKNCQLTQLDLHANDISDKGLSYLRDAMKHENCQLTQLNLAYNSIKDKGVSYLCDAMKHENCQLTHLNLAYNLIKDKDISDLCDVIKHENCQLMQLNLCKTGITDKGLSYLCDTMKHEYCQLTHF